MKRQEQTPTIFTKDDSAQLQQLLSKLRDAATDAVDKATADNYDRMKDFFVEPGADTDSPEYASFNASWSTQNDLNHANNQLAGNAAWLARDMVELVTRIAEGGAVSTGTSTLYSNVVQGQAEVAALTRMTEILGRG